MAKERELTVKEFASMGGNARRDNMTEEERKASAKKAAAARWAKFKAERPTAPGDKPVKKSAKKATK